MPLDITADKQKDKKPSKSLKKQKKSKEDTSKSDKKLTRRLIPTHFVGFRVPESNTHAILSEIQKHMIEKDAHLTDAAIPLATLHVTLMILCLTDEQQVKL